MRIVSVGAGPAALYFALLLKKASKDVDITLIERNQPDDTFGWGVVFSEETLGNFERTGRCTLETFVSVLEALNATGELQQLLVAPTRSIEDMRAKSAVSARQRAYRKRPTTVPK